MFDFLKVVKEWDGKKQRYVYSPSFVIKPNIKDLMIRSKGLYAIYDEESGLWVTEDSVAVMMIDQQVREFAFKDAGEDAMNDTEHGPIIKLIADTRNKLIDNWHKFCERDMRDHWYQLNQKVIFSNTELKRSDYASIKLDYPLQECPTPYYDKLCEVLYSSDEEQKWEWAVGCIIAGDQKKIQKMLVFYGEPGTGKSTIIGKVIADNIFGGYETGYASKFEANNLAGRDSFGTDFLEKDSVLAYDDDAELGVINSKTTLNKIISHEPIRVNCKFKPPFITKPNCLLIVGSNDPVQMSPNSGMNRRLIDVRPTGTKLDAVTYDDCIEHLPFERSGIAWKCLQVYKKLGKHYYDHYIAEDMLSRTSPFQNFVTENYFSLKDGISLANAYKMYTDYAETCNFKNVLARYKFRDTLKLYFDEYSDMKFSGFKPEKIGIKTETKEESCEEKKEFSGWLNFSEGTSLFDIQFKDAPAQYANDDGLPSFKWEKVKTLLRMLDTHRLHYVKVPLNHIVIDFDIKGEDGAKDFQKNLEAANAFPPTYAELSKSGSGIHLHYIYTGGDPTELSRIFGDNVEIKVFTGNASLRRKLTKCNNLPIAELNSGLPLKEGGKKVVDWEGFKNEKVLRSMIIKNLRKEYHPATKPSIDYIEKLLCDAFTSGAHYDVRDLKNDCLVFALNSTHKFVYCVAAVNRMHFCSQDVLDNEIADNVEDDKYKNAPIIFLDIEVSPSYKQALAEGADIPADVPTDTPAHLLINWKFQDNDHYVFDENSGKCLNLNKKTKTVFRMIDPEPAEVEELFKYRFIGHNVRGYDNHILYAKSQGYANEELYDLSKRIVSGDKDALFNQARRLSYTDTLDFAAAGNKQSLKKYEIKFGARHLEWKYAWNVPVPKDKLQQWAEYCDNDVISAEMLFDYLQPDFEAREILAAMSGLTVNDTTNQHTIAILTHDIKDPQKQFVYTDLSTIFPGYEHNSMGIDKSRYNEDAKIVSGKSIYRGEDPGEGGHKIGYRGIYTNVALMDVASMHPHSAIRLGIFGKVITQRYSDLVEARVCVKHIKEIGDESYNNAIILMNKIKEGCGQIIIDALSGLSGKELKKKCKAIANALKTAINSVYGLTSASFDNKLRDPRNVDNIVAKYGALFMINLKHELWDRGFKVVHVSTDSIKVADATPEIIQFIMDYGKQYGYTFEHEATYSKMCLVDDTNYIAYEVEADGVPLKEPFWTATGKKFAVPYIFKSLFTHEPIIFDDMCETISVKEGALHLIYDDGGDNFVGRVGLFTPVTQGGATLYRVKDGKKYAASGTKGYKWLESESVIAGHLEDYIDRSYYQKLCDDAVATISKYGDFEEFVSDSYGVSSFDAMNPPIPNTDKEELPWDEYVKKTA